AGIETATASGSGNATTSSGGLTGTGAGSFSTTSTGSFSFGGGAGSDVSLSSSDSFQLYRAGSYGNGSYSLDSISEQRDAVISASYGQGSGQAFSGTWVSTSTDSGRDIGTLSYG